VVKEEISFIPVDEVDEVFALAICAKKKSTDVKRANALTSRVTDGVRCKDNE